MDTEDECLLSPTVIVDVYCEEDEVTVVLLLVAVDSRWQNVPYILRPVSNYQSPGKLSFELP